MIRLGIRLALAGGREAGVRLGVIAAAVALGVGLLLAVLAGGHAVDAQNARYAWLNSSVPDMMARTAATTGTTAATTTAPAGPVADPVWWLLREDHFRSAVIGRVDVAVTGPNAPTAPGISSLPGPGEFYASPALRELLRTTPAAELGDRFPGRAAGTITGAALPSPDSLLVIVGHRPDQLAELPGAVRITGINTIDPSECSGCPAGIGADAMKLVLGIVAVALIFPVLIFIGTATRLAAARREQRFAAMRLVGATPRQVVVLATIEAALAAVVGTAVGFILFVPVRPALAAIPFTGEPFFSADLTLALSDVLLVVVGVPAAAAVAAWFALRRVQVAPLGVTRRVPPPAPRAWRLVPLVVGVGELVWFVDRRPGTTNGQLLAYLSGIVLIMVGLVVAGPWLTLLGSRVLARRASRPATLIAARRLADDPKASFRAVSGLMLALFVTSVATGVITTIVAERGAARHGSVFSSSLAKSFWPEERVEATPTPGADAVPAGLRSIPGVRRVLIVHANPITEPPSDATVGQWWPGVISCAELAAAPEFGGCPPGAAAVAAASDLVGGRDMTDGPPVWPAVAIPPEQLRQLPVLSMVVDTDGSPSAVERTRTLLATTFPQGRFPATVSEWEAAFTRSLVQFQQLANVVILASLPIAGCSLAVGVAGGLNDRRRPFGMLRLTGAPLAVLRRVVALESGVPLLVVAVLAIGVGFLAAQLFLTSQLRYSLHPPGTGYYLVVVAGLAGALGILAATMPLLRRLTGPDAVRNE